MKSGETLDINPADPPPLVAKVTQVNQHSHLDKVVSHSTHQVIRTSRPDQCEKKRQLGGIGSSSFDPKQKDIRAFFGGATVSTSSDVQSEKTNGDQHLEEGRSASNVFDETEPTREGRL